MLISRLSGNLAAFTHTGFFSSPLYTCPELLLGSQGAAASLVPRKLSGAGRGAELGDLLLDDGRPCSRSIIPKPVLWQALSDMMSPHLQTVGSVAVIIRTSKIRKPRSRETP